LFYGTVLNRQATHGRVTENELAARV